MKKILITGGNGLLGQVLRVLLSHNNFKIIATGLGSDRLPDHTHIYKTLDISIEKDCIDILEKYSPDVIINAAAITNVDYCETNREACFEVNANSVNHFLTFCKKNKKKFIQISTDFIFNGKSGPYLETSKSDPLNYYGFSKMKAEKNILDADLSNFAIIRTCLVYGFKEDSNNIFMWVKRKLEKGEVLNIVDDQYRTPTIVSDLSKAIFHIIEKDIKGVYNISGGEYLSIFDFVCNIAKGFGFNQSIIHRCKSKEINQKANRPKKSGLLIEKAKRDFDFSPTNMNVFLKSIK